MKTYLLAFTLIWNVSAHAAPMNRFWVGSKKSDITIENFMKGLNQIFFQETIAVGQGRGLLSYQPYVTKTKGDVPDELALVIYESEEKYKAIRSTPEGQKYGERHWEYFQKENSKSTVSVPFAGELQTGGAYQLRPEFMGWQKGHSVVAIYEVGKSLDLNVLAKAFADLKQDPNLNDAIVLVTEKFVYEYRSYQAASSFKTLPLKSLEVSPLPQASLKGFSPVGFGSGINFQF